MIHSVKDTWLRAGGISLLMALVLSSDDAYKQPMSGLILVKLLFDFSTIVLTWHTNRAIILWYRSVLRTRQQRFYRLFVTFGNCVVATTALLGALGAVQYVATNKTLAGYSTQADTISITLNQTTLSLNGFGFDWLRGILNALFYLVIYGILFSIQDVLVYRQQLEQLKQEKEQLRVANMQSQLNVLKQQVNPHFLFNALNTLSALISESPQQAEQFVDKLSEIYRYVLQANHTNRYPGVELEQHLTTLDAELQFIDSYYHLLKTRYGDGLTLNVAVNETHRACQLPPLTLQLLVENAVKHNVVSPKRPLSIQITSYGSAGLLVSNTLQRKQVRALSNGVGLTNISSTYQLLNLPGPVVEETNGLFTVTLALLVR